MLQRYLGHQIVSLHVPGVRGQVIPVNVPVTLQCSKVFTGVPVFGTDEPSGGIHQKLVRKGIDLGIRVIDGGIHLVRRDEQKYAACYLHFFVMNGSAAQKEHRVLRVVIRAVVVYGTNGGAGGGKEHFVQLFLICFEIINDWLGLLPFLNIDIGGAGGADDAQGLYFRVHENVGLDICFQ